MVQNQEQPVGRITFSILIALSLSHCLNDLLQSVISAAYPLFKEDLGLNFAQIGLITLVYQLSASVFQPITGIIFDKHPVAWSLPIGMSFTMIGMINLAFSNNLYWMLISVFSDRNRFFRLASGGITYHFSCFGWKTGTGTIVISGRRQFRRFTRSFIGGFAGSPLWQRASGRFYTFCFGCYRCHVSDLQMVQILSQPNERAKATVKKAVHLPLPMDKTALSIGILLILIFSKYIYMASLTSYYTFYLIINSM